MKSEFKKTNFSETGVLTAVDTEGKKYYKAIDIARSLGYKRPDAAVKRFCKNPFTIVAPTFNQYGGRFDQPVKFIDYDDVMRILYGSTLPKAVKFRMKMEELIEAEKAAVKAAAKKAAKEAAKKASKQADKDNDIISAIEDFVKEMGTVLAGECGTDMPKLIVISF